MHTPGEKALHNCCGMSVLHVLFHAWSNRVICKLDVSQQLQSCLRLVRGPTQRSVCISYRSLQLIRSHACSRRAAA